MEPAAPESTSPPEEDSLEPEARWYLTQSSYDLQSIPESTLRFHIAHLNAMRAEGKLNPTAEYVLGWMQLDHASLLVAQAKGEESNAQKSRLTVSRVSRYDASTHEQAALKADEASARYLTTAKETFDAAINTFTEAATRLAATRPASALKAELDGQAATVYKALLTSTNPEEVARAVEAYMQYLVPLDTKIRRAEYLLPKTGSGSQKTMLQVITLQTACCLLISASTDELARHLVLPNSPRSGGSRPAINAIIFPLNAMEETYELSHPISLSLAPGSEVTSSRHEIRIGTGLLIGTGRCSTVPKKASPRGTHETQQKEPGHSHRCAHAAYF